jgi:hypothetical protein
MEQVQAHRATYYTGVYQLEDYWHWKSEVGGSSPLTRTNLTLMLESKNCVIM